MGPTKKSSLLLPLLLLIALAAGTRRVVLALSIGAALDADSRIGKEQKIAIQVAATRLNASSSQPLLSVSEFNNSDTLQAGDDAQVIIQAGAEVIISTGTWPQVLSVSSISKRTNIPTVSLTPSSTGFLSPLLIHMSYSDVTLAKCLAGFVASFRWRRVILVYQDDDYGTVSGTAVVLTRELQEIGTQIDYSAVFPPANSVSVSDLKSTVRAELNRMSQHTSTVYIVLRTSENLTMALFQEATSLGMMKQGSSWICGPDTTTLLDSTINSSFILKYMQGVIGIEPYINRSMSEYLTFDSEFQSAYRNEYEKSGETVFSPGVYAARAYDSVQAIVFAANNAKVNNNSLVNNLLLINFTGLSGYIKPVLGNVEETSGYSAFRVVNVVGKSYKEIGFWLEGYGFYNDESELSLRGLATLQQLSVVFWPGGSRINPGGLKRLKIGVPANPTWDGFIKVEHDDKTGRTNISGFCIDVFAAAVKRLNSQIQYDFVPYTIDNTFTYDMLVKQVYLKNIDIAVGDITTTSYRAKNVSFTAPFVSSGLAMIVHMKRDNVSLMLMKPFTPLLWVTIFTMLFYNFGVVWYLERHHEKADGNSFKGPWYTQIEDTFWIIGNTIFQNYGDRVLSFYTKVIIISWLLVVLIMSNCFVANLSSILVAEKLKPVIDKSIAGYDGASFVKSYLQNVLNYKNDTIVPINRQNDYPDAFRKGNITAAFIESPYVRVFLSEHHNYAVYGEVQMLGGFAFALQKGDPMTSDLSKEILSLAEDGTIKQFESKWFSVSLYNFGTTENNVDRESLGLDVFWSLLVFSFGTSLITLATFMIKNRATSENAIVGVVDIVPPRLNENGMENVSGSDEEMHAILGVTNNSENVGVHASANDPTT